MNIVDLLRSLATDDRLQTLLALIALDLVMGVAAALRTRTFRWAEVGRFYGTTVLPLFLGWSALWLLVPFIAVARLGPENAWIGNDLLTVFWFTGVAVLVSSIATSVKALGISLPSLRP